MFGSNYFGDIRSDARSDLFEIFSYLISSSFDAFDAFESVELHPLSTRCIVKCKVKIDVYKKLQLFFLNFSLVTFHPSFQLAWGHSAAR